MNPSVATVELLELLPVPYFLLSAPLSGMEKPFSSVLVRSVFCSWDSPGGSHTSALELCGETAAQLVRTGTGLGGNN